MQRRSTESSRSILLRAVGSLLLLVLAACADEANTVAGVSANSAVVAGGSSLQVAALPVLERDGVTFTVSPVIELRDERGNLLVGTPASIEVGLATGTGRLDGTRIVGTTTGRAVFDNLRFLGTGPVVLRFNAKGFGGVKSDTFYVAARTISLDPSSMQLISDSAAMADGRYAFTVQGTPPTIDSGTVVVLPDIGRARRVLAVQSSGGVLTLRTGDVGVEELGFVGAYADSVDLSSSSAPSRIRSIAGVPSASAAPLFPTVSINGLGLGFGSSATATASLQMTFAAYMKRAIAFDKFGRLVSVDMSLGGTVTLRGQLDVTATAATKQSVSVPVIPATVCFPASIGPVVGCLAPSVTFNASLTTTGAMTRSELVTATGNLAGGMHYDAQSGVTITQSASAALTASKLVSASVDQTIQLSLTPEMQWRLFGLPAGPFVAAGPFIRVTETVSSTPPTFSRVCDWGLELKGGVKLQLTPLLNLSVSSSKSAPFGTFSCPTQTPPPPPNASLVAYYPFDGNANDASGNGFDATFNNAQLAAGVSGQTNTAYHFNGASEIRLPATPTNSLTAGTVSVWVRLDDTNAQYNIFAKVPSAGTYPMRVQFGGAASGAYAPIERWCFIVNTPPPGDCTSPAYSFTPTSFLYDFTSWHLYTFTWTTSGRQIYRDGFLITSIAAVASSPASGELVLSPPSTSGTGVPERLKGSLDDLRIYNYALSASEVAALYSAPPGPAPVSGGHIAFMSVQPSGAEEIFAMDPSGGQRTQLTFRGLHSESPQWSPDGSQIAYQGDVTSRQNFEIHVMNADGSNDHVVSPDPSDDAQPFWSPDGKQIVFQSRRAVGACAGQGAEYKIYVMDVNGANLTCLGFQGVQSETPSFSPDGSKITYFVNLGPGQAEIWVMNANGSNKVRLTSGAQDFFPRWSPDGTQILFERNAASICVMYANGSGVNCVASGRYPSWSPSSGHIVFTNLVGGVEQIFRVARTGGAVVRVATTSTRDLEPVWTH